MSRRAVPGHTEKLRMAVTDRLTPVTPRTKRLPRIPVDAVAADTHGAALQAILPRFRTPSGTGPHPDRDRRLEGRTAVAAELLHAHAAGRYSTRAVIAALIARVWPPAPVGVEDRAWQVALARAALPALRELGAAWTATDTITTRCADCETLGEPNVCARCSSARYAWHDVLAAYAQRVAEEMPKAARAALGGQS